MVDCSVPVPIDHDVSRKHDYVIGPGHLLFARQNDQEAVRMLAQELLGQRSRRWLTHTIGGREDSMWSRNGTLELIVSFPRRRVGVVEMTLDLFDGLTDVELRDEPLGPGAIVLRSFATPEETALAAAIEDTARRAPFRHMITPGGFRMSVAMTNCGPLGWVSDRTGYRYAATDPVSGLAWPEMPESFLKLAVEAAEKAGFPGYAPDACLINRYEPGAKLSLHQDKDEQDYEQPIVSVSLGLPAVFLFGGLKRSDKLIRVQVVNGDVVVWGGPARLRYHGVQPLKEGHHPLIGGYRINLTFRKAA